MWTADPDGKKNVANVIESLTRGNEYDVFANYVKKIIVHSILQRSFYCSVDTQSMLHRLHSEFPAKSTSLDFSDH